MGRPKKRTYAGAVKLREKTLSNGDRSLYLDIYHHGKRSYDFLKLYLTGDKVHDANTLHMAETIRAERELELMSAEHGITAPHRRRANFIDYFEAIGKRKQHKSWTAVLHRLREFAGDYWAFDQITPARLEDFKLYLLRELRNNTAWLYYGKVQGALNEAVREGYLQSSPAGKVWGISRQPVEIAFLTLEEIRALKAAECPNAEVRRAFLFSCFTGMARCDIRTLTWGQVKDGWVRYRRQKTKETVSVPLHPEAAEAIGEPGNDSDLVFADFPSDRYVGHALTKWAQRAKVSKNVTFHVARHTFATLSLTHGANIYTISKLLGHTSVKITQEYAKVVDRAKEDAIALIPSTSIG